MRPRASSDELPTEPPTSLDFRKFLNLLNFIEWIHVAHRALDRLYLLVLGHHRRCVCTKSEK